MDFLLIINTKVKIKGFITNDKKNVMVNNILFNNALFAFKQRVR